MPNRERFKTHEEYLNWYRNYRKENIELLRNYYRRYNKVYRKIHGYKNEINSKKRYPEKEHARRLTIYAIRTGKIKRGNCEVCGS